MGFDMGIMVRRDNTSNSVKALKQFAYRNDKAEEYDFEIAYWRKCWNVYSDIEYTLNKSLGNGSVNKLGADDIKDIIKLLKSYNKKTWDYSNSIWSWQDYKAMNRKNIRNLKKLIKIMRKYPEISVIIYISY